MGDIEIVRFTSGSLLTMVNIIEWLDEQRNNYDGTVESIDINNMPDPDGAMIFHGDIGFSYHNKGYTQIVVAWTGGTKRERQGVIESLKTCTNFMNAISTSNTNKPRIVHLEGPPQKKYFRLPGLSTAAIIILGALGIGLSIYLKRRNVRF